MFEVLILRYDKGISVNNFPRKLLFCNSNFNFFIILGYIIIVTICKWFQLDPETSMKADNNGTSIRNGASGSSDEILVQVRAL